MEQEADRKQWRGRRLKDVQNELVGSKGSTAAPEVRSLVQAQAVMVELITEALDDHSASLAAATRASDRYAERLVKATWGLVGVTSALVLATIALIVVTWYRG